MAVFAGRVVDINKIPNGYDIVFDVYRYWKGLSESDKIITTSTVSLGGGDCGYPFQEGEEYLTYASKNIYLHVDLCGGTQPLADAGNELAMLGSAISHDSGIVRVDPSEIVAAPPAVNIVSVLLITTIAGLSAGIAVLIIRKPQR
jgi:hypothetical protein